VVIAVVGVNGAGKTHFIAASLTEAYKRGSLASIGCSEFQPDDATSQRFMAAYERPLFREGKVLPATQTGGQARLRARFDPLIFNVTLVGVEPFNLVVHDIAGELLGDRRQRVQAATFLNAAKGIIFVVDPRDIDGLREQLPAWTLDQGDLGYDQAALLGQCLAVEGIAESNTDGMIPVAVVLAKADLLPRKMRESLHVLEPSNPGVETHEEMLARIRQGSENVEAFLDQNGGESFLTPARNYERRGNEARVGARDPSGIGTVTYHAVSALGSAPDSNGKLSEKVRPINCADPLAAVLAQTARLSP
jgi:hypothetical protein